MRALRSAPRHQHAADREDQRGVRGPAGGPRRAHGPGRVRAAVDGARTREAAGAGVAGGEAPRSRRGRADAQGGRDRRLHDFPWLDKPGSEIAAARRGAARGSGGAGAWHGRPTRGKPRTGAWAGRPCHVAANHGHRPEDAAVPDAPALCAHVSGGARLRLRAVRCHDGGADAGAQLPAARGGTGG